MRKIIILSSFFLFVVLTLGCYQQLPPQVKESFDKYSEKYSSALGATLSFCERTGEFAEKIYVVEGTHENEFGSSFERDIFTETGSTRAHDNIINSSIPGISQKAIFPLDPYKCTVIKKSKQN